MESHQEQRHHEEKQEEEQEQERVATPQFPLQEESDAPEEDESESSSAELERLRRELLDDGLDELLAGLEQKSDSLRHQLDQLRRLKVAQAAAYATYADLQTAQQRALQLHPENHPILAQVLLDITRRCSSIRNRNAIKNENVHYVTLAQGEACNYNRLSGLSGLKVVLKRGIVAANEALKRRPKDQLGALDALSGALAGALGPECLEPLAEVCGSSYNRGEFIEGLLKELASRLEDNKYELLRSLLVACDAHVVVDRIGKILGEDSGGLLVAEAVRRLARTHEDLPSRFVQQLRPSAIERLRTEADTSEYALNALQAVVRQVVLDDDDCSSETPEAASLSLLLLRPDVQRALNERHLSASARDFLHRARLMRALSAADAARGLALQQLRSRPEAAVFDASLRDLLRESAALTMDASSTPLRSARDVPVKYLKRADGGAALEDFLIRRRVHRRPLLICKGGFQAVVPAEAARGVQAGRVEYLLIDEHGCGVVKPMHALQALKEAEKSKRTNCRKLA